MRKCFGRGNYCKHNLKHQRRAIKQRIPHAAKSATNYAAVRRVKYGRAGAMQYNLKLEHRILHQNNTILPYQLFTCSIVSPVSCANCFFWSSDGYGCWNKQTKGWIFREQPARIQQQINRDRVTKLELREGRWLKAERVRRLVDGGQVVVSCSTLGATFLTKVLPAAVVRYATMPRRCVHNLEAALFCLESNKCARQSLMCTGKQSR